MGHAFLTDFGIAKSVATGSKLTRTGQALGTPHYMSPEQARGEVSALTPATDVWSLGCVLYEMLAGRPPFEGETSAAIVGAVLVRAPADLRRLRGDLPGDLLRLLAATLAKEPRARPPGPLALRHDLARLLQGERVRSRAPRSRRVAGALAMAGAGLLAAAAAAPLLATRGLRIPQGPVGSAADDPAAEALRSAREARPRAPAEAAALLRRALDLRPGDRGLRLERADCLREAGLWLEAERAYTELLAGGEPVPGALSGRALTRWLARETKTEGVGDPVEDLAAAARLPGERGSLARGIRAVRTGLWAAAEQELAAAGESWEALLVRALLRHHGGRGGAADQGEAVRDFSRALERGPTLPWVLFERAHARTILRDSAGALSDLEEALRLAPGYADAWNGRGVVRNDLLRDPAGALGDFEEAARLKPDYLQAVSNQGNALRDLGRFREAVERYTDALRIRPDYVEALVSRAAVREDRLREHEAALADLDEALRLEPDAPAALVNRSVVRRSLGDLDGALADLDQALRVQPRAPHARYLRGLALAERGDPAASLGEFTAAVEMEPAYAEAWFSRANVRMNLGDPAGAREDYAEAVRIRPGFRDAAYGIGNALRALGEHRAAIEQYGAVLERHPGDPQALTNRGTSRWSLGEYDAAAADFRAALASGRAFPEARLALRNLGVALQDKGDLREATRVFEEFLGTYADDPRAGDVRRWLDECRAAERRASR